jgi:hypothetical protein
LEILRDKGFSIPRLQGFKKIQNYQNLGMSEADMSDDIRKWLTENKEKRFFIWFHILSSHLPYKPSPEHLKLFWEDDMIKNEENQKRVNQVKQSARVIRGKARFNVEQDAKPIKALYHAGIHQMDATFGRIVGHLEKLGLRDETIIVFSADHGEELFEHGFIGHASTALGGHLHDEITHVPLIISLPGKIAQDLKVPTIVRGIDIMPTLFELLEVKSPVAFQGKSLVPMMTRARTEVDRIAYSSSSYKGYQEENPKNVRDFMRAVRTKNWKLFYRIWDLDRTEFFLYDLENDPGELHDVKEKFPEKFKRMKHLLFSWEADSLSFKPTLEAVSHSLFSDKIKSLYRKIKIYLGFPDDRAELIAKAPQPRITYPERESTLTYENTQGELELRWDGLKGVPYILEVSAGTGEELIEFTLESEKPFITRKVAKSYWEDFLVLYQPVRVRVKIDAKDQRWSEWRSFNIR